MTNGAQLGRGETKAGRSVAGRAVAWLADGLAALGERPGAVAESWRVLLMRSGPQAFDVYFRKGRKPRLVGTLDPLSDSAETQRLARQVARAARRPQTTVLRLAPNEVVHVQLSLPAGVREVLGEVLRNQLESHAPWPAEQALYAFASAPAARESGRIEVDLWVTGKARVTALLGQLARHRITPGIVDFGANPAADATVDLTRSAVQHRARRRRALARLLTAALVAGGLAAVAATGWMIWRDRELAALDRDLAAQRRSASAAALARGGSELEQIRRTVLAEKTRMPSMAIMIEGLSQALPDQAHLERLEVRDGRLTIVGKATSAPALVAPLEASPHLAEVQFAAPTTRQPGDDRESFTLSARIVPKAKAD